MHNLSDEELDRLSREAAEVNQTPVSPAGWDTISSKLDKEMPVPYKDKTLYLRIITDLLLLLTLAYAVTQYPSDLSKPNAIQIQPEKESVEQGSVTPIVTEGGSNLPTGQNNAPQNEVVRKKSGNENGETENKTLPGVPGSVENKQPEKTTESQLSRSNSTVARKFTKPFQTNRKAERIAEQTVREKGTTADKSEKKSDSNPEDENAVVVGKDQKVKTSDLPPAGMPDSNPSGTNTPDKTKVPEESELEKEKAAPVEQADSVSKKGADMSGQDNANLKEKKKKSKSSSFDGVTKNALQIGITWSPDFSRVGHTKPVDYGNTLGITAGYQINKRWSVQTAILYTNKYYTTIGDAYGKVPGYNNADPYVKIKQVNAECFMWDIPLNIRYNWLVRRSSRAFVSTGFSSYFMNKEDLHYWYTHYNNPKYKHWINETNSNYWFAIGNISAGFEQYITPSISLQVEPFFKFSLREVGYGQINLKSSGIFLGLKYTPPLHLSKK